MNDIFFSTGSRKQIYDGVKFGEAHYSYNVVFERIFCATNAVIKKSAVNISHPEIYKSSIAKEMLYDSQCYPIHIAVKSPEDIRLLDGAYNIAHVAWEFNKFPHHYGEKMVPIQRPTYALSLLDEVWVGCSFTKKILSQEGIENVYVIPAPIPQELYVDKPSILEVIGGFDSLQLGFVSDQKGGLKEANTERTPFEELFYAYYDKRSPKVYVTVANIWDHRKNLPRMLKTFERFHSECPDSVLVVKLVLDNVTTKLNNVNEIFGLHFSEWLSEARCNGVFFVSDYMSDNDITQFLRSADFYINFSRAEGQCLPVLEAMANGVVPISVKHTAMLDYIEVNNSFIVNSSESFVPTTTPYPQEGFSWNEYVENSALEQLRESYNAGEKFIKDKSEACIQLIRNNYSVESVGRKILDRIRNIQN